MLRGSAGIFLNKLRYTLYTPIYDLLVKPVFREQRKRSIESLNIGKGSRVLIVGAGTGLDFEFLDEDVEIHAGDITPSMLAKMKSKARRRNLNAEISIMNGQSLNYSDGSFDYVILHLILAVIPDPIACIKEVERVAKAGAAISVFDKFVHEGKKPSLFRRLINIPTALFFSDITRDIDQILVHTALKKKSDEPAAFGGNFRIIRLEKEHA